MKKVIWKFNEDYKDYAQVEQFYNLFLKLYNEITSKGGYAYNSCFEGKLGIADKKEEKTAIYLLQRSKRDKNRKQIIDNLLKDGFQIIERGEGIKKFNKIVQVGTGNSEDSIKEFDKGKIVFEGGYVKAILPKRCRTRGYLMYGERLILAKEEL